MKKLSFSGLTQNKVLLVGVAMIVVLALGSVAFMQLNGAGNSSSSTEAESNPQTSDDPASLAPTQPLTQDVPTQPSYETNTATEPLAAESKTPTESFSILQETACVPDNAEYQVATVVDALGTEKISVLIEGETHTVKFLGIDTHIADEEVSEGIFSANKILIGKTVALVADEPNADDKGNLLRYVFTENAFINLALIERGLATISDTPPAEACAQVFMAAQEAAKSHEIGVWERLKPENWRQWPVIPVISDHALDIYLEGLAAGTNPKRFSIIGDCQNIPGGSLFRKVNWDDFSLPPELEYLQPTLENFRTIWSREPVTVGGGFIPASMFSTYWTDTDRCNPIETPLECEFRLNNASILLISIGSDQKPGTADDFDRYMREIVEYSIEKNVLPIITTDAYATEEGFPLNQIMAQIAYEYDIPLWNFWASVQDLPNHGLKEDNFHISAEAFAIKRISGVQVLHAVLTAAQQ